jgi:hypothetical protein
MQEMIQGRQEKKQAEDQVKMQPERWGKIAERRRSGQEQQETR